MQAKLAITTRCGAHCVTCPSWTVPEVTMDFDLFQTIWDKLNASWAVSSIFVNGIGDFFQLPNYEEYLDYMEDYSTKRVAITTNGLNLERVPMVDEFIISFNGCDRETYERTTGNSFAEVVNEIRGAYRDIKSLYPDGGAELHCLAWEGNPAPEEGLLKLFGDFPGKIRVSYKYDNNRGKDRSAERLSRDRNVCDYLRKLTIYPTGDVIPCCHDMRGEVQWGNLRHDGVVSCLTNLERAQKLGQHVGQNFVGICTNCNYNRKGERIVYIT